MVSEKKKMENNLNPLLSANLLSKFSFWWLKDLIWYGNRHDLQASDLYETTPEDQSGNLINKIDKMWDKQLLKTQNNKKPSLWALARKTYGCEFLKYTSLLVISQIIQTTYPLLLEAIMSYFQSGTQKTPSYAYFLATSITGMLFLESILRHYGLFKLARLGVHLKIAVSQMIFKKILRMPAKTVKVESFANLLSTDVNKIEIICPLFHHLFMTPVQSIAMTYMMVRYAGTVPGLIGMSLMILQTLPLQVLVYKITVKLRAKQTAKSDTRIFLISEVIDGIRAIKMYVWEDYFKKLLSDARRKEIAEYLKIAYVHDLMSSVSNCNSRVTLLFMMMLYTFQEGLMRTSQIVPIMKILWTLKERWTAVFLAVRSLVDVDVSIKRIENFLLDEEVGSKVQTSITGKTNQTDDIISMNNVRVSWSSKVDDMVLDDININIHRNSLYVLIGSVGTGKSTLIKLMLGELTPISGQVSVNGKVSYVDQHPWLFKGSVKDNILFGEKFDEEKYQRVVEACDLLHDFEHLPSGDRSSVGENGSMLSGGQRTRVNLARAVYRDADIYLLDDPFSSLDVRVANRIFKNCVCDLLNNKTRVLVTYNPQYIAEANLVVVLNNGTIEYEGPSVKSQLPDQYLHSLDFDVSEKFVDGEDNEPILSSHSVACKQSSKNEFKETDKLLVKGSTSKELIHEFMEAGQSYFNVFLMLLMSVLTIILSAGFDYYIVAWSQEREIIYNNVTDGRSNGIVDSNGSTKFLSMVGSLVLALAVSVTLKSFIFDRFILIANRTIHDAMTACLIRGPIKYFEVNSSGRILNRFAEDTGNMDSLFPKIFYEQSQALFGIVSLLLPVIIADWWYSIPVFILMYLLHRLYKFCVPSIRSIRRLERTAKSPVLSSATSCYAGRVTIRSHCAEEIVVKEFSIHQDHHTAAYFLSIASSEGFYLLIDILSNSLFAVVIFASILLEKNVESAGYIGLSLGQIMNVTSSVVHLMKQTIAIVSCMINLERMIQFTKLDQEESFNDVPRVKPLKSWPDEGKLEFESVYLRYSDEIEPTLKNINLVIEPGAKIGIVGRTGAGKSSLISVLFRLTKIEGSLLIDGINTNNVSLSNLRSKISIIPQRAALFNASLRKNLDPLNTVDDATLWSALNDVELQSTFDSLEYVIEKGGDNLSVGQRQLLCLARVIVKNNKILVLDEATANLDPATDAIIQKIIKSKFADCTVISVAHKLTTVIDSDKLIVMDNGQVVEYDHPHLLLQKSDGYFSSMVNQTGGNMIRQLKTIAKKAYFKD